MKTSEIKVGAKKYCLGCGTYQQYEKWGCPYCGCRDDADGSKVSMVVIGTKKEVPDGTRQNEQRQ